MPELPEVETIVRELRRPLVGRTVVRVRGSGLPLRGRAVDLKALAVVCVGGRFCGATRRGKYILLGLDRGTVLVHLGMSGRLTLHPATDAEAPHTHVVWTLGDGRELRFVDPRRFGWVAAVTGDGTFPELARLGPDPLAELDAPDLAARLAHSRTSIKTFLLDQRRVAGLGNIYVCEALHRAAIHPGTRASRVRGRAPALLDGIRGALADGIANRGTTLRDYVGPGGEAGNNFAALRVYARENEPCPRCRKRIRRRVDAGRPTFFCPGCQLT